MQLRIVNKLRNLSSRDRKVVGRFMEDGEFRSKLQAKMVAKGLAPKGLDPNNVIAWLEIILKYLPQIIVLIAMLAVLFAVTLMPQSCEAGPLRNFLSRCRPQANHFVGANKMVPQYRIECDGNTCRRVPVK